MLSALATICQEKIKLNKGAGRVIKSSDLFPVKSVLQVLLRWAMATRQSELLHSDNVRLGRTVDTVVDEQTGFAAQRERVMAVVPA